MPPQSDVDRDLNSLAAALQKLEGEYNMFFAGRLPRPPWESRKRVDAMFTRFDRAPLDNVALRFRFSTLQARYATLAELWDRGLRAREEGRPGPFSRKPEQSVVPQRPHERIVHVASFSDPLKEMGKLQRLYDAVMDARRENEEPVVPFHKFVDLVKAQVAELRQTGSPEVAFRVTVDLGRVSLKARALKGAK